MSSIIKDERLKPEKTKKFIDQAFEDGYVTSTGLAITNVLPPMPLFGGGKANREKKETVLTKLTGFFNRFFNV